MRHGLGGDLSPTRWPTCSHVTRKTLLLLRYRSQKGRISSLGSYTVYFPYKRRAAHFLNLGVGITLQAVLRYGFCRDGYTNFREYPQPRILWFPIFLDTYSMRCFLGAPYYLQHICTSGISTSYIIGCKSARLCVCLLCYGNVQALHSVLLIQ